jgi:uncharacterized DUF497 family protein
VKQARINLDIDENNEKKLQKHGLKIEEIKKFFQSNPSYRKDTAHSVDEPRYIAFGPFEDFFMFVSFTTRIKNGKKLLRPISARKAREREIRRLYEDSKK